MSDTAHPIDTLWAYVAEDHTNPPFTEGVVGYVFDVIGRAQLIAGSEKTARTMEPAAREVARVSGKTIRLVKFTRVEVVKTIPGGAA